MNDRVRDFSSTALRVAGGCLLGVLVLALSGMTMGITFHGRPDLALTQPWVSGLLNHSTMLVYSLLLILLISRGRLASYGLGAPACFPVAKLVLLPSAVSILASLLERVFHLQGLAFLGGYSLLQKILLIWILASVAEETLTRGLIQGFLAPLGGHGLSLGRLRLSLPVLTAALFFGAMHLMLLTMKVALSSVLPLVAFAFVLGLIAGYYRERTGSLWPAILVHACANAAGTVMGLLLKTG